MGAVATPRNPVAWGERLESHVQPVGFPWYRRIPLVVGLTDAAMIVLSLVLTFLLRFGRELDAPLEGVAHVGYETVGVVFGIVWMVALSAKESRRAWILGAGLEEYRRVVSASFYAFGTLAILSYLAQAQVSRLFFVTTLPVGIALLLLGRWVNRLLLTWARQKGRYTLATLVVGDASDVKRAVATMRENPAAGYLPQLVCLTDTEGSGSAPLLFDELAVMRHEELEDYLGNHHVDAVVVAGGLGAHEARRLAWQIEDSHTRLLFVPRLADVAGPRLSLREAGGLDFIDVALPRYSGARFWLKRSFDMLFASAALVLVSPVLAAIAIAIKLDDGGPIFFRQERIGLEGNPFTIHKFRTMHVDAEARLAELRAASDTDGPLFKMTEDPRVTRVGRVLRKFSLDELPQFWTVLLGDMSVVGPRPHLADELAEFPDHALRRLLIKPGITGLWQISGRSDLSLEESIRLDLRYVESWSLSGDIAIILKTVRTVLRPEGAY